MPALLPVIGLGLLGSALKGIGARKPTETSQQSTSDSTKSSVANLTPQQEALMKQLSGILNLNLAKGPVVDQTERNLGRTSINNTYAGLQKNLESNLTARGFGESGKLGAGFKGLETSRANAFQGLEGQLRGESQARFERMLGMAGQFIQPHDFTETGHSTSSGTGTQSGTPFLSTFGGGVSDIGSLLLLKSLLGGGGGLPFGGTGYGGGNSLGGNLAGCWIAVVLYTANDPRIPRLRQWIGENHSLIGRTFAKMYRRYGYQVAQLAIRRPIVRRPLKVIFDRLMIAAGA